jgi:cobalt-zinc-cadmium resistance protein CzcA
MIRRLVDFALTNRLLVLAIAILLFVWGVISFRSLPVEAYPDVANNYVQVITQWPGISAEQVEQQVTIPLEIVMNGISHLQHLRSTSLFGLSSVMMIFDDDSDDDWNRVKVLERLSQVMLPAGVVPQMGADYSPVGQIYFFTLHNTNPQYDVMDLKSLEDWTVEKQFKSVPNVVDVASFGGPTREYQVRVDPNKLIAYGLSLGQIEQQLANNNVNGGGSFIEAGLQQINVRAVGQVKTVSDIEKTVITTKNGTALRVKDIAAVQQGPKIRLGQFGRAFHRADGRILARRDPRQGEGAQRSHSSSRSDGRSLPRPQRPAASDHRHGDAQPDRRHHPRIRDPVRLPGECPGSADRHADDPVLAAVCLDLPRSAAHPGESALPGRPRLRDDRGGRRRHDREHRADAVAS